MVYALRDWLQHYESGGHDPVAPPAWMECKYPVYNASQSRCVNLRSILIDIKLILKNHKNLTASISKINLYNEFVIYYTSNICSSLDVYGIASHPKNNSVARLGTVMQYL